MSRKFIKAVLLVIAILVILAVVFYIALSNQGSNLLNQGQSQLNSISGNLVGRDSTGYESGTSSKSPSIGGTIIDDSYNKQDPTKIIKNSNITMQTDNYDESLININLLIDTNEAMVVKMRETLGNNYYNKNLVDGRTRNAELIVKVSKDKFDNFNTKLKTFGSVISYYEDAQDVSSKYADIEAKISSYTIQEGQLNELLKKATVAKDLLEISNQIQSVIEKRESLQRQKNSYDNQIEFSTVTISLSEVASVKITEKTYLARIKDTFVSSLTTLRDMVSNLFIFIVYMLPYIATILFILLIMYIASKSKRKDRK